MVALAHMCYSIANVRLHDCCIKALKVFAQFDPVIYIQAALQDAMFPKANSSCSPQIRSKTVFTPSAQCHARKCIEGSPAAHANVICTSEFIPAA